MSYIAPSRDSEAHPGFPRWAAVVRMTALICCRLRGRLRYKGLRQLVVRFAGEALALGVLLVVQVDDLIALRHRVEPSARVLFAFALRAVELFPDRLVVLVQLVGLNFPGDAGH